MLLSATCFLNQLTIKLISVSLMNISLAHRILGVRDMGSNFYPFTAARNGNKLVTKGLFSKLLNCLLTQHAVRLSCCVTLPHPPYVLQKFTDMLGHIAGYVRHPIYCGLCFLTFGLCAITGSQARLALSVACWILLHHQVRRSCLFPIMTPHMLFRSPMQLLLHHGMD